MRNTVGVDLKRPIVYVNVRAHMARDDATWSALADPNRRLILDLLRANPKTTGDLSAHFRQSRYAVMNHLNILEGAGLVTFRREGRERWNYINATPLRRIYERWLTPYQQLWAANLSSLGKYVEGDRSMNSADDKESVRVVRIEQVAEIGRAPEAVFDAITNHTASWWAHTTYDVADRPDLRIEPYVGGRFIEKNGPNERLYAIVTRYEPPNRLWMQGPMGIHGCILGTIGFELEPIRKNATKLALSHHMMGVIDDAVVNEYRGGWTDLLENHLPAYLETGAEAWQAAS